jgi:hypothetical protein
MDGESMGSATGDVMWSSLNVYQYRFQIARFAMAAMALAFAIFKNIHADQLAFWNSSPSPRSEVMPPRPRRWC